MKKKLQYFSVLFFILIIMFFIPRSSRVLGDESEAVLRVSQAEDSLKAAYLSVLEAERAGGDVSELALVLNTALEYYSEAEMLIEAGEYEAADFLARKVVQASNVALDVDISLIVVAEHVEEATLWNQIILSFGAVFFIILLSFLGWRRFKIYYIQRVLGSRLEVVVDEP